MISSGAFRRTVISSETNTDSSATSAAAKDSISRCARFLTGPSSVKISSSRLWSRFRTAARAPERRSSNSAIASSSVSEKSGPLAGPGVLVAASGRVARIVSGTTTATAASIRNARTGDRSGSRLSAAGRRPTLPRSSIAASNSRPSPRPHLPQSRQPRQAPVNRPFGARKRSLCERFRGGTRSGSGPPDHQPAQHSLAVLRVRVEHLAPALEAHLLVRPDRPVVLDRRRQHYRGRAPLLLEVGAE